MNSSNDSMQNIINFFFLIFLYIPVNIIFMLVAAVIFNLFNKIFHLRFPAWAIAVAAGTFIFIAMVAYLSTSSNKGGWVNFGESPTLFYTTTAIINILVIILMLTISGINRLVFKNQDATPFVFEKPQLIATIIYAVLVGCIVLQPFFQEQAVYAAEKRNEKELVSLQETINNSDLKEFEEASKDSKLWEAKLPGEQSTLFEYLVAHNKPAMVHLLIKDKPEMFSYSFNWEVNSPEMLQTLIDDGMNANKAIDVLTKLNDTSLVKLAVKKYKPSFDTLVSFITKNVVENNNTELLDYLVQHGLTKHKQQTDETLYDFARSNNMEPIKMLADKGFKIDTSQSVIIYYAIYYNNLPLLKYLFTYPFDVNAMNDEYTNVENAIIGDKHEIFDYLMTLHPDVTTIHTTGSNGEINALKIAEIYKQSEMLKKLQHFVALK